MLNFVQLVVLFIFYIKRELGYMLLCMMTVRKPARKGRKFKLVFPYTWMLQCWFRAGRSMWETHKPLAVAFSNVYQFLWNKFTSGHSMIPDPPPEHTFFLRPLCHIPSLQRKSCSRSEFQFSGHSFFSIMITHSYLWLLNELLISLRKWRVTGSFICVHIPSTKLSA